MSLFKKTFPFVYTSIMSIGVSFFKNITSVNLTVTQTTHI